jgi:16S rRNA (guanine527-N7)-methyltransferase
VSRIWNRHLLNSAMLAPYVPAGAAVLDVGSGAGLPGIPLWLTRPDLSVTLAEPMLRRETFLREVVDRLGVPIQVVRARATELPPGSADVVVARALAPLAKLIPWLLPLVKPGGTVLALKGESAAAEIGTAAPMLRQWPGSRVVLFAVGTAELATTIVRIDRAGTTEDDGR